MTASIIVGADAAPVSASFGRLAGFRSLFRKDTTDWVRGKRAWVVLAVSTAFMVLSAANAWIIARIADTMPAGEIPAEELGSMAPVDNLLAAVSAQIFVVAAIFVAGSLMARERESGTLAWVASKPVTRASIWTAKWVSATAMLALVAGLVPLAATVGLVTVLYGAPPVGVVVGLAAGIIAAIAFFTAVGLGFGTVLPGQAASIAAGFAVFAILPIVGSVLPIAEFLPTSMVSWPAAALSGASVSFATPVAWLAITAAVVAFGVRRTVRMEL